jgi:hypothetical protein
LGIWSPVAILGGHWTCKRRGLVSGPMSLRACPQKRVS